MPKNQSNKGSNHKNGKWLLMMWGLIRVNKAGIMNKANTHTQDVGGSSAQLSELISCVTALQEEIRALKQQKTLAEKPCYTTEEALSIFGVTVPTLRKWRNEGYLGYTQVGSTILYSREDIDSFLKSNHYEAYAA